MDVRTFWAEGGACAETKRQGMQEERKLRAPELWLWALQGRVRTWDVTLRAVMAAVGRDRQATLATETAGTWLGLWEKRLTCVECTAQETSPADRD